MSESLLDKIERRLAHTAFSRRAGNGWPKLAGIERVFWQTLAEAVVELLAKDEADG